MILSSLSDKEERRSTVYKSFSLIIDCVSLVSVRAINMLQKNYKALKSQ